MDYTQYMAMPPNMGISLEPDQIGAGISFEQVMGNLMWRMNPLPRKGDTVGGHTHNFDHVSFITSGSVHVVAKDEAGAVLWEKDLVAGDPARDRILVKAEVRHEITALEDSTFFYCIYAHRTPQGDVAQEYTGYQAAYQ